MSLWVRGKLVMPIPSPLDWIQPVQLEHQATSNAGVMEVMVNWVLVTHKTSETVVMKLVLTCRLLT